MKNLIILFGLSALLLLASCKDKSDARIITVLPTQEFHDATAGNKVQLLDVRTPEEFKDGHVTNAININVLEDDFTSKAETFDKQKPVYLYCRSGKRSAKASAILKDLGFKEIYDMEGGFLSWEDEGLEAQN